MIDDIDLLEDEDVLLSPDSDDKSEGESGDARYEHWRMTVDDGQAPLRIDKYITEHNPHSSRNRVQTAADAGCIWVNGRAVKSNYKVRPGDVITLMLDRPKHDSTIVAEDIPLDIVYEDSEVMVVNKRPAWWFIPVPEISAAR